jgi:hypothetical protein
MPFTIKQNDTLPALVAVLKETDGTPIDLTTATGVQLVVKKADGTGAWKKAAAFVTPRTEGKVQYNWVAADTSNSGTFNAEFEIAWPGGIQTVPNNNYFQIEVAEDLG